MAKNRNRKAKESRYGFLYKTKFGYLKRCLYCGGKRQCLDHVFPISKLEGLNFPKNRPLFHIFFQGLNKVPSCLECNNIAGDKVFTNIRVKREYIQEMLKIKYRKILNFSIWTEEDLEEVSESMKKDVLNSLNKKQNIEMRISWPSLDSKNLRKLRKVLEHG